MPEKMQNESCIVGLPYCGHFFGSEPIVFMAVSDIGRYSDETGILAGLLQDNGLRPYLAPETVKQEKTEFCEKICSRIINSRFCIVFIDNDSRGSSDVHMLYGLMLAFNKIVVPLEKNAAGRDGIRPLPSILYYPDNFMTVAQSVVGEAVVRASSAGIYEMLVRDRELQDYFIRRGLRILQVGGPVARAFYRIAYPLEFMILEGNDYVFFGSFEHFSYEEISSRTGLLIKGLSDIKDRFETLYKNTFSLQNMELAYRIWSRLRIEVIASQGMDIGKLASGFPRSAIPVEFINREAIR
jgi:hypothetical protein